MQVLGGGSPVWLAVIWYVGCLGMLQGTLLDLQQDSIDCACADHEEGLHPFALDVEQQRPSWLVGAVSAPRQMLKPSWVVGTARAPQRPRLAQTSLVKPLLGENPGGLVQEVLPDGSSKCDTTLHCPLSCMSDSVGCVQLVTPRRRQQPTTP